MKDASIFNKVHALFRGIVMGDVAKGTGPKPYAHRNPRVIPVIWHKSKCYIYMPITDGDYGADFGEDDIGSDCWMEIFSSRGGYRALYVLDRDEGPAFLAPSWWNCIHFAEKERNIPQAPEEAMTPPPAVAAVAH